MNTFLFVFSASSNLLIISITGSQFRKTLKIILRIEEQDDTKATTTLLNTRRATRKGSKYAKEALEMRSIAYSAVSIHDNSPAILV